MPDDPGTLEEKWRYVLTHGEPVGRRARRVFARLASAAGTGEILISERAYVAAGLEPAGMEERSLSLKGKSESVGVHVLTSRQPPS